MTIFEKAARWFKGLTMTFSNGASWSLLSLGRTRYDYAAQVGDGRGNSAVEAVVRWVGRTFPEAPVQVLRQATDGTETPIIGHPMIDLLSMPNPYYSGELLWRATLADWVSTGNGYWIKARNGVGGVVQLWWAPSWMMAPFWPLDDPTVFISYYNYTVNGAIQKIPVEDVVHFRDGMDPRNTRLGLSPIAALAREIFTDDEAANMTASLVKNLGVPGVIISPEGDDVDISKADGEAIKADFKQRFGGDNRGEPMVMPARTKVSILSWSPEQMNLRELRRIPEERVTAVLGVPAIVVNLGAGLDRATYANMAEAREAAYESFIIPNQRLFGADLKSQLLGDFGNTKGLRVGFDTRAVRVLQEDENKKWPCAAGGCGWPGRRRSSARSRTTATMCICGRPR
jgi:HK97 family phage portal protein